MKSKKFHYIYISFLTSILFSPRRIGVPFGIFLSEFPTEVQYMYPFSATYVTSSSLGYASTFVFTDIIFVLLNKHQPFMFTTQPLY
jgi:hypothetical protein